MSSTTRGRFRTMFAMRSLLMVTICFLSSTALAAEPATRPRVSRVASSVLFVPTTQASIERQAAALGFDGVEPSIFDLPRLATTRPVPTTGPLLLTGVSMTIRLSNARYAALNVGTLTTLHEDDPDQVDAAAFLDMAEHFHAVMTLPLAAPEITGGSREDTVRNLRRLGGLARRKQVSVVLDTPLGVDELNALIDAVGSPAVRAAFDPLKISAARNDPYQAFRLIGHARIGQVRLTCPASGSLEDGLIQLSALKEAINDTGWSGCIVLQAEADRPLPPERVQRDAAYLRSVFDSR